MSERDRIDMHTFPDSIETHDDANENAKVDKKSL